MLLLENIKIALSAIWVNKVRSFLTMLGVIIGVASVISLLAMGQGVKKSFVLEMEAIGSNLIAVTPGKVLSKDATMGSMAGLAGISSLTLEDSQAIREEIQEVEKISALQLVSGTLIYQDKEVMPMLVGAEEGLEFTSLYKLSSGRFLLDEDVKQKKKYIVIGQTVADDLFGQEDPLGKKVIVQKEEFEVIGVVATESISNMDIDANLVAVIPISLSSKIWDSNRVTRIFIQARSKDEIKIAQEKIKELLLTRHDNKEDFSVVTQEDMLAMFDRVLGLVTVLLSGIAAISLVVGGVGIMNIMLVSVTERTREIGIRKACGATNGNILGQFLIEAAMISLLGGGIGILLSGLVSFIVRRISALVPEITLPVIFLAFGISCTIGIIFGIAPAIRASRKDPIEALRYE